MTPDQARTQDLERRGFHGAQVRSDGLRAVIELGHVTDVDRLLRSTVDVRTPDCVRCSGGPAVVCSTCAGVPEDLGGKAS